MKTKNKLVARSIGIKNEAKNVMFWSKKDTSNAKNTLHQWILKKDINCEKHLTPMDLKENLRKSDVLENSKVYYGRFPQNGLHEWYSYIGKNRWDDNMLKSTSHWLLVERWR